MSLIDANDDPGGSKILQLDGVSVDILADTNITGDVAATGDLALTGDITLTGDLTVTGAIAGSANATVADPGDGETITPPASGADFECEIVVESLHHLFTILETIMREFKGVVKNYEYMGYTNFPKLSIVSD